MVQFTHDAVSLGSDFLVLRSVFHSCQDISSCLFVSSFRREPSVELTNVFSRSDGSLFQPGHAVAHRNFYRWRCSLCPELEALICLWQTAVHAGKISLLGDLPTNWDGSVTPWYLASNSFSITMMCVHKMHMFAYACIMYIHMCMYSCVSVQMYICIYICGFFLVIYLILQYHPLSQKDQSLWLWGDTVVSVVSSETHMFNIWSTSQWH